MEERITLHAEQRRQLRAILEKVAEHVSDPDLHFRTLASAEEVLAAVEEREPNGSLLQRVAKAHQYQRYGERRNIPKATQQYLLHAAEVLEKQPKNLLVCFALDFLQTNYRSATSLDDVAGHIARSKEHLARRFKREVGISVGEYVRMLRTCDALLLLPEAEELKTIAYDLGFRSYNDFFRVFRAEIRMSPAEYREAAQRQSHQSANA